MLVLGRSILFFGIYSVIGGAGTPGPKNHELVGTWPDRLRVVAQRSNVLKIEEDSEGVAVYFKGDTNELNQFLEHIGRMKQSDLDAALHSKPGIVESDTVYLPLFEDEGSNIFKGKPPARGDELPPAILGYDWGVYVAHYRGEQPDLMWSVIVNIHLKNETDLSQISLPSEFRAHVGDSVIHDYVIRHNQESKEQLKND